jgi:biopolymer transport protein ExbD
MSSVPTIDEPKADDEPSVSLLPPRRRAEDSEMDITPMIDVTFLLLIFFLVSSTPDRQTAIALPKAYHGVAVSQLQAVVFTIAEGGLNAVPVYAADGRIPGTELSDNLDARSKQIGELVKAGLREGKPNVVIKGDKNVAYREVARVVKAVSQVQGVEIYLAVLEPR